MRTLLALGTALVISTSAQAATNLIVNGSFEDGTSPTGVEYLHHDDTTSITGWKVLTTGINYVDDTVWDASNGSRSVELTTLLGNGGIMQRVGGFTVGYSYEVTFDVSANPFDDSVRPLTSRINLSMSGGQGEVVSYTLNDVNTPDNMLYDTLTYRFVAVSKFMNIQFRGQVAPHTFGPVLDNVSVSVVPEASTWAMLIAGFSLVGLASRRRNRAAVAA